MSLQQQITEIIAQRVSVSPERLSPRTDLRRELHCDELKLVELIVELEERFHVEIDGRRAQRFRTVQDAIDFVERYSTPLADA